DIATMLMIAAFLGAAVSSAGAAHHQKPKYLQSPAGERIAILPPPARYDHRPAMPVVDRVLPLAQARAACAKMGARADACSWMKGGKCFVVIPRDGPVRDLNAYRRHEFAHCNGWPEDHPG